MIKNLLLFFIFLALSLRADCNSYYLLGSLKQSSNQIVKTKEIIAWDYSNNKWSVSQPKNISDLSKADCKEKGYLLINNNEISYNVSEYSKNYYEVKKGWNFLSSHINGISIEETFSGHKDVEFVYTYEPISKVWAGYSPLKELQNLIYTTKILDLKNIEPRRGFYVYARKDLKIDIKSLEINDVCKNIMVNEKYAILINSGISNTYTYNKEKTIGLKSRYTSHYKRGVYDESRVALIYPKLETQTKRSYKYGPADPKTQLEFTKEYEGMSFYMYSYYDKKCYKGVFPSIKIPPMASLKELK